MIVERGEGWEMRLGRWQDSPPDQVDHVISDPPFTDHVHARAKQRTGLAERQGRAVVAGPELSFDAVAETDVVWAAAFARRWSIFFCAIEQVGRYEDAAPGWYIRGGWWSKTNGTPQFTGDRPGTPGECMVGFHPPGKKRWNKGGHPFEYRGPVRNSTYAGAAWDQRIHETQKPLWLMREMVLDFTDPRELVWDPYAGGATTGVACLLEGRRFIGHEEQEDYFWESVERLRAAEKGQPIADYKAGQVTLDALF